MISTPHEVSIKSQGQNIAFMPELFGCTQGDLMLSILKLIHMCLAFGAIGAGISVCIRMVTGRPFEAWVKHFLRFSLAAGSVGLILSIGHTTGSQLLTMLSVYVSALAVLFWRKCCASDTWAPALVLSTMCVLCLDTVIMFEHIFRLLSAFNVPGLVRADIPFAVSLVFVVILFGLLSMTVLKKLHQHEAAPLMHKVAR